MTRPQMNPYQSVPQAKPSPPPTTTQANGKLQRAASLSSSTWASVTSQQPLKRYPIPDTYQSSWDTTLEPDKPYPTDPMAEPKASPPRDKVTNSLRRNAPMVNSSLKRNGLMVNNTLKRNAPFRTSNHLDYRVPPMYDEAPDYENVYKVEKPSYNEPEERSNSKCEDIGNVSSPSRPPALAFWENMQQTQNGNGRNVK